jgi:hypothetical protein
MPEMYRVKAAFLIVFGVLTSIPAHADVQSHAESKDSTHEYHVVSGAKLYTESLGQGSPVLFLHGGLMFFDNAYAKQRDYFAVHHRSSASISEDTATARTGRGSFPTN